MVDEVTNLSVFEQMVTFVQFYDRAAGAVKVAFLFVDNLLENYDSAKPKSTCSMILSTLKDFELSQENMCCVVSDGASVMVWKHYGVAA